MQGKREHPGGNLLVMLWDKTPRNLHIPQWITSTYVKTSRCLKAYSRYWSFMRANSYLRFPPNSFRSHKFWQRTWDFMKLLPSTLCITILLNHPATCTPLWHRNMYLRESVAEHTITNWHWQNLLVIEFCPFRSARQTPTVIQHCLHVRQWCIITVLLPSSQEGSSPCPASTQTASEIT